jgi:hypothetical protein
MEPMTDADIARSSHAIAEDGPAAHEDAIAAVALLAAAAGAPGGVLDALTDHTLPGVVRSRAWAHAVTAVRRCRSGAEVALAA